jgi:hypothetical protein
MREEKEMHMGWCLVVLMMFVRDTRSENAAIFSCDEVDLAVE